MSDSTRNTLTVLIAALLALGSPRAAAAGDAAESDAAAVARRQLREGRNLYELGRYQEAIDEFERAYQATDNPTILYNLAQSHRRLDNHARAAELYQAYLRRVPDAPNREEIEARILALRALQAPPNGLAATPVADARPPAAGPPGVPAAAPASAIAIASLPVSGAHVHNGFYARVLAGPHYFAAGDGGGISIGEVAFAFSLSLGGALSEHWILFGEMSAVESRTDVALGAAGTRIREADLFGVGAGAAYYFTRSNAYVSTTLLDTNLILTIDQPTAEGRSELRSASTAGLHVAAGKEWWVGSEHGIGVAVGLMFASSKIETVRWQGLSTGVSLSWTYN